MLTVTEESANLWRYNLSEKNNSRLAYGKTITTDYMADRKLTLHGGQQPSSSGSVAAERMWDLRELRYVA